MVPHRLPYRKGDSHQVPLAHVEGDRENPVAEEGKKQGNRNQPVVDCGLVSSVPKILQRIALTDRVESKGILISGLANGDKILWKETSPLNIGTMETAVAGRASRVRPPRPMFEESNGFACGQSVSKGWVATSLMEPQVWSSSSSLLDFSMPLPRSRFIQVPHVRQLCNWDCGLACVLMVLKALGVEGCDLKYLSQLCHTTSIWTVDLAHLLRHFAVDVAFLTVTIGANPNFAVETFYKENMEEDGERVNKLFETAPQVGIEVQWRSITGEEISMLILSGRYLAIALVDKRKLSHPWLDELCLADCCGLNTGYTGHYVVICGYDMDTDEFEIRDPASGSASGRISLDALDEARKSYGTDEDILVVSLKKIDHDTAAMAMLSLSCSEKVL